MDLSSCSTYSMVIKQENIEADIKTETNVNLPKIKEESTIFEFVEFNIAPHTKVKKETEEEENTHSIMKTAEGETVCSPNETTKHSPMISRETSLGYIFCCDVCPKSYNRKEHLSRHMRCHSNIKPYNCSFCSRSFSQKNGMQIHLRTHTGERPYDCSFCGKSFADKSTFKRHLRIHSGVKPYSCSVCFKSFRTKYIRDIHYRVHTGYKPFVCSMCNRSFTQKAHLEDHVGSHSNDKPFHCELCNKTFKGRGSLGHHMRTYKHDILNPEIETSTIPLEYCKAELPENS